MGVHYTKESNMPRECRFMNSTTPEVICNSALVTTVINDGSRVLIEFRRYFKVGGIANMLGDKTGILKEFGRLKWCPKQ